MKQAIVIILGIFAFTKTSIIGQENNFASSVVQLSGVVVSGDSLLPAAFTSVIRSNSHVGVITNDRGFFTLPVFKGDTILFSNVGYGNSNYIVPTDSTKNRYSIVQVLTTDTINIPEVEVYPWPAVHSFKNDFLALNISESKTDQAIASLKTSILDKKRKMVLHDDKDSYQLIMQQNATELYYKGQPVANPLKAPISLAWVAFVKALLDGSMKPQ